MMLYDEEVVYDEQIAPLMEQIIAICQAHGIPLFATFAYAKRDTGDDGAECCTTLIPIEGRTPSAWVRLAAAVVPRDEFLRIVIKD